MFWVPPRFLVSLVLLLALATAHLPLTVSAQSAPSADAATNAVLPSFVPVTPGCVRDPGAALRGQARRRVLSAAAQGTLPSVGAADLVASCETSPTAVADSLNRGGLRAHREGDYARAVRFWELAVQVDPARTGARYNLACGYALTGQVDKSLTQLEELTRAGEDGARWIERAQEDSDLASLRTHPRFRALRPPARPAEP